MPILEARRYMAYSAQEMFALVADIEKYPEFLPACKKLSISSSSRKNRKVFFIAEMSVGYGIGLEESFTSHITLDQDQNTIQTECTNGPFKYLLNKWDFSPTPSGCIVSFSVDYKFKSLLKEIFANVIFKKMFSLFIDSFEKRANECFEIKIK